LLNWRDAYQNLAVHVVLSEERVPGRRYGLVTEALAEDVDNAAGCQAYLAGPPAMVDAATDLLKARGLASRDIHADAFYPADPVKESA
jgi:CDP-4-dehydro-6-deoxyglucose reductase/ferredoxin-NAD(P)+ reductase (naphthalene dioxygenase ferredoxin-specific)